MNRFDKILSKIDKNSFIDDFSNKKLSIKDLCKKYSVCAETISKIIARFNLERNSYDLVASATVKRSEDKFQNLINSLDLEAFKKDYLENLLSYNDMLVKYNLTGYTLDKLIRLFNLKRSRKASASRVLATKYSKYGSKDAYFAHIKCKSDNTKSTKYGSIKAYRDYISDQCYSAWMSKDLDERKEISKLGISHGAGWNKETIKQTNLKKYGVSNQFLRSDLRKNYSCANSKPNLDFASRLDENNICYDREFNLDNRCYDFKIGNTLIEINPTITHNITFSPFNNNIAKDYHKLKSLLAEKYGYRCLHVWDWDNIDKIIDMLLPMKRINARSCIIKNVTLEELDRFLYENHLQGTCKHQSICLGLYFKDELIQVITFGKPRYNKHYEYELLRLCTKAKYVVIGGSQKLFKYFLDNYKPTSIISYCDKSKFSGNVYLKLGFKIKSETVPSKHWYNIKTKTHITDNLLRQRGFDQLFHTKYGKGVSNEKLMIEHGFLEIYDCGQAAYEYQTI